MFATSFLINKRSYFSLITTGGNRATQLHGLPFHLSWEPVQQVISFWAEIKMELHQMRPPLFPTWTSWGDSSLQLQLLCCSCLSCTYKLYSSQNTQNITSTQLGKAAVVPVIPRGHSQPHAIHFWLPKEHTASQASTAELFQPRQIMQLLRFLLGLQEKEWREASLPSTVVLCTAQENAKFPLGKSLVTVCSFTQI